MSLSSGLLEVSPEVFEESKVEGDAARGKEVDQPAWDDRSPCNGWSSGASWDLSDQGRGSPTTRRSIVLHGGVPIADKPAPYDFTWAFVVLDDPARPTRLVVRERYAYRYRWSALLVEPVTKEQNLSETPELVLGPILRYAGTESASFWVETSAAVEVGRQVTFAVEDHFALLLIDQLSRHRSLSRSSLDGRWSGRRTTVVRPAVHRNNERRVGSRSIVIGAPQPASTEPPGPSWLAPASVSSGHTRGCSGEVDWPDALVY